MAMNPVQPVFFDTHAHLDYPEFAPDFAGVLSRAEAAGITRMISIGTSLESSRRAIGLAETYASIFAVAGWHPADVLGAPPDVRPALRELAGKRKVVALGETGLDYYRLPSAQGGSAAEDAHYKERQAEMFRQHLEVAAETGLNCVIHQRAAFDDTLALLKPFAGKVRGVFHCFGESVSRLRQVLAIGSLVSYTGIVTFKNGQNIREAVAATPLNQFMLETDCPYLAPAPHRGKRCEPAFVKEIAGTIAQTRHCSLAELSAATRQTAEEFFPKLRG